MIGMRSLKSLRDRIYYAFIKTIFNLGAFIISISAKLASDKKDKISSKTQNKGKDQCANSPDSYELQISLSREQYSLLSNFLVKWLNQYKENTGITSKIGRASCRERV